MWPHTLYALPHISEEFRMRCLHFCLALRRNGIGRAKVRIELLFTLSIGRNRSIDGDERNRRKILGYLFGDSAPLPVCDDAAQWTVATTHSIRHQRDTRIAVAHSSRITGVPPAES